MCQANNLLTISNSKIFYTGLLAQSAQAAVDRDRQNSSRELSLVLSRATFYEEDREILRSLFESLLQKKTTYPGVEIDIIVKREHPDVFDRYGSVRIRNKFRDQKARFLEKKFCQALIH